MLIESRALETDIFFRRATGSVIDRGDHLVISTPQFPIRGAHNSTSLVIIPLTIG